MVSMLDAQGFRDWTFAETSYCKPLINKPPPLNEDYNRDPKIFRPSKGGGLFIMGLRCCVKVAGQMIAVARVRAP